LRDERRRAVIPRLSDQLSAIRGRSSVEVAQLHRTAAGRLLCWLPECSLGGKPRTTILRSHVRARDSRKGIRRTIALGQPVWRSVRWISPASPDPLPSRKRFFATRLDDHQLRF